jgi:hypothetical protein
MADPKEFIGIYCPNGCTEHNSYQADWKFILIPIWGKRPNQLPEPMVVQCQKCKFEAWINKKLRDELGKPDDPYLENQKAVIPEKIKKVKKK